MSRPRAGRPVVALALLLALALQLAPAAAPPADARTRVSAGGTLLTVFWCSQPARAARIPAMVRWRFESADTITQVIVATWLRVATTASSPQCAAGETEVGFTLTVAVADVLAEAVLRSEGYDADTSDGKPDYDAMTPAQIAAAFSAELGEDLRQWEGAYLAHLAALQAPEPDPVEPLQ